MKNTTDLMYKIMDLGYSKDEAWQHIDLVLDDVIGYETREKWAWEGKEEMISNKLYNDIYKSAKLWKKIINENI